MYKVSICIDAEEPVANAVREKFSIPSNPFVEPNQVMSDIINYELYFDNFTNINVYLKRLFKLIADTAKSSPVGEYNDAFRKICEWSKPFEFCYEGDEMVFFSVEVENIKKKYYSEGFVLEKDSCNGITICNVSADDESPEDFMKRICKRN